MHRLILVAALISMVFAEKCVHDESFYMDCCPLGEREEKIKNKLDQCFIKGDDTCKQTKCYLQALNGWTSDGKANKAGVQETIRAAMLPVWSDSINVLIDRCFPLLDSSKCDFISYTDCLKNNVFKLCPDSVWKKDANCQKAREAIKTCTL